MRSLKTGVEKDLNTLLAMLMKSKKDNGGSNTNNKVQPPKRRPNFRGESAEDKQPTASPKATPGVTEATPGVTEGTPKANPEPIQLKKRKGDTDTSSYWPVEDDLSYVEIPYIPPPPSNSEEAPKKGIKGVIRFQANQTKK